MKYRDLPSQWPTPSQRSVFGGNEFLLYKFNPTQQATFSARNRTSFVPYKDDFQQNCQLNEIIKNHLSISSYINLNKITFHLVDRLLLDVINNEWLECVHAAVHVCMSTWLLTSAPSALHSCVQMCGYLCMSQSPLFWSQTLVRMCTLH